jgi:hypothetical protein
VLYSSGTLRSNRLKRRVAAFTVRPSIGEALANEALRHERGTVGIVHAKRNAVGITEVKLDKVAVQMRLGAMLIAGATVQTPQDAILRP